MAESVVQGPRPRRRGTSRKSGRRGPSTRAKEMAPSRAAYMPGPLPALHFPPELPVSGAADQIVAAVQQNPVVIVCGETGSGKTTQLPKICALAGRGQAGRIGHTQPRRIAATSVARRIADELGTDLGVDVGFKVRFGEELQASARFKLMTDGILLAETQGDRNLHQYDTLIIDEAHERSLNIDFLIGYLKRLLDGPRRDDLKVIITSATIDADRFARHFTIDGRPAPVIEVSGRLFPVQIRYQSEDDSDAADDDDESDLPQRIERALVSAWDNGPGDVLVFLPGEREIRDSADHLRRASNAGRIRRGDIDIVPLYARLSVAEQQRVFGASNGRRVVLATNVAETSLTVPGIRYVIDTGLARVKRYRLRGKVEQLQIEKVSQAAANQRAGRCGRVSDGVCIRLFAEQDYQARPRFTDPEILRSSLAAVILRMKALRLGDVEKFPFVDAPPARAINDGYALLLEVGAVDNMRRLTRTGSQLARLPVDPRIGRMLLAAHQSGCLAEVLVIAAALSTQDPRDRPLDAQQAADEAHKAFADPASDFVGQLRMWQYWRDADAARATSGESRGALNRRLQRQFLSVRRLREWSDVHRQLAEAVRDLKWKVRSLTGEQTTQMAAPELIHKALLSGLLGNLGHKPPDEKHYLGTHQTRFVIHPSSGLSRRQPRWLMAAEMVDTARLYGRTVAAVQPGWIEHTARHLIRRHWSEPFWASRSGQAMRYESGVLYGLTVYSQRRVPLAPHDPQTAREMFIRHALAEGDWPGPRPPRRLAYMAHNAALIESIRKLEQKIRRPDLLVDEQFLFDWFDARVGAEVTDARTFEAWFKRESKKNPRLLKLTRDELLRKDAAGVDSEDFPRHLQLRGIEFALEYRFEPGAANDGVTMTVPLSLLNQVDENRCEWLVPGLLADKVQALIKSLPQRQRRHLVPVPEYVRRFCERHPRAEQGEPLIEAIRADARQHHALQAQSNDFRPEVIPRHLHMNFRLVDSHGRQLATSRSLVQLRADHGDRAAGAFRDAFQSIAGQIRTTRAMPESLPQDKPSGAVPPAVPEPPDSDMVTIDGDSMQLDIGQRFTRWPVAVLPELLEIREPGTGTTMVGFPALVDRDNAVAIEVFDDQAEARSTHRGGVRRLLAIGLRAAFKSFFNNLESYQNLVIAHARIGTDTDLRAQMADAILQRAIGDSADPVEREAFDALLVQVKPRLNLLGQELARNIAIVLDDYAAASRKIATVSANAIEAEVKAAVQDCRDQIEALVYNGFIASTPPAQFVHLPRYLRAIVLRLERVRADPGRDTRHRNAIAQLDAGYRRLQRRRRGLHDPQLANFRWLIEELRVSLFAQSLRTPTPVSLKRLNKMLHELQVATT